MNNSPLRRLVLESSYFVSFPSAVIIVIVISVIVFSVIIDHFILAPTYRT